MKNILFIAPPAAGKGLLSEQLVEKCGYVHISTGEMLRSLSDTSPYYEEVSHLLSEGKFASDELVMELLGDKLKSIGDKPFILDGCPRNMHQAYLLEEMLDELGVRLDIAIELDVPYEVSLRRVSGRIVCQGCKAIFNKDTRIPLKEGVCDRCGSALVTRDDDDIETFKSRYETYLEVTKPLLDFYRSRGKLVTVDGINNTFDLVLNVVKND